MYVFFLNSQKMGYFLCLKFSIKIDTLLEFFENNSVHKHRFISTSIGSPVLYIFVH